MNEIIYLTLDEYKKFWLRFTPVGKEILEENLPKSMKVYNKDGTTTEYILTTV